MGVGVNFAEPLSQSEGAFAGCHRKRNLGLQPVRLIIAFRPAREE